MYIPFVHPEFGPLHLGRPSASPRTKNSVKRALTMHEFLIELPLPPASFDNTNGITDWGQMENDHLGDCTCAALGHLIQAWTSASGPEVTVPDSAILKAYQDSCGYDPANPASDQGGIIRNVLDYFRKVGVGGYQITADAEVNITQMRVQQAIYIFGGLDVGVELPIAAQSQTGLLWDIENYDASGDAAPGTWGGHSVAVVKYDPTGVWCVTWGLLQKMTWRWLMYYCDEAYAAISPLYTKSPVPVGQLVQDLQAVGS